jgi:hypothetical protein
MTSSRIDLKKFEAQATIVFETVVKKQIETAKKLGIKALKPKNCNNPI